MYYMLYFFNILIIILITIIGKQNWVKHYGIIKNNICYTQRGLIQISEEKSQNSKYFVNIPFINLAWINFHLDEINIYCINFLKYKVNVTYPSSNHIIYYIDNGVRKDNPYYYGSHVKLPYGTFLIKKKIRKGICMIENKVAETNIWPYVSSD